MHTEQFIPHSYDDIIAKRAFPEGALPEVAYHKLCREYAAVADVIVQRITYDSGGLNITGLMIAPARAPKGLVIYNRGGSGNYGMLTVHAVMRQFVPLARAGYTVVGSNYRGNDGSEGKDEFGGRDVEDVIHLYNLVKTDDTPLYLIGHSRGGMMTYLLLKHGLKARAAIVIAAVADLRQWNVDRSEMRERVYKRFIPNFETNEEVFLTERSPVCWPEAIHAPMLLLHGTADDRVPVSHSEAMASAFTQLGKPHKLVHYEGGNHALTRHWSEVMKETLEWLTRHQ